MNIPAKHLTNKGLVDAFYASYGEEENPETRVIAREILDRGDAMWNWEYAIADAQDELSVPA